MMLPLPLRQHHAQLMLHAQQRAEHVGVEGGGIAFGGLLRHRAGLAFGAGVVDGHVQATKARNGPIDQVAHLVLVAHVGRHELGFSAERAQFGLTSFLAGFLVATGNDECGAPSRANATAVARPIPVSAPVIKTTGVSISPPPSDLVGPDGRLIENRSTCLPIVKIMLWWHRLANTL